MRVVVIGTGLLGSSILEAVPQGGPETWLPPRQDVDITSESSIRAMLNQRRPDVVINTAAFHDFAACEADERKAFDVNARAAERLARLVPTVYISTDYVFTDGGPHTESLPGQQPRSVYGRSKLAGELATLEHGGIVVRVSGLFGHHVSRAKGHKGFPDALLKSHDSVRLPTDQTFSPTYAPDATKVILRLAERLGGGGRHTEECRFTRDLRAAPDPTKAARSQCDCGFDRIADVSGIYHANNRGSTTWAEFAESVLALTRHERHVLPVAMRDPLRPKDSSLKNTRLPSARHWQQGLGDWARVEGHFQFVSAKRDD